MTIMATKIGCRLSAVGCRLSAVGNLCFRVNREIVALSFEGAGFFCALTLRG